MHKLLTISFLILLASLISCKEKKVNAKADFIIGNGQIPNIAKDKSGIIHVVYGLGDSIMYTSSSDNGQSFSSPSLVAVLPKLFSFAMRGPQVAVNNIGVVVTACNTEGNIFSYCKDNGTWKPGARINDADTIAKEGLMFSCRWAKCICNMA